MTCAVGLAACVLGCAKSDDGGPPPPGAPHLLALSTYSASLGTSVDAFMANPPPATAKKIELVFDGTFTRSNGSASPVSITQPTVRSDAGAVRWTSFGPFANPFLADKPDTGVFTGKVGVRVTNDDGTQTSDGNPLAITFQVQPSLIVTDLQPTTASCEKPALRLIGSMQYKMSTMAIGFAPDTIDYTFTTPSVVPDPSGFPTLDIGSDGKPRTRDTKLSHHLTDVTDSIGDDEAILLPPVPQDQTSYGVVVAITARDASGHTVTSAFGMTAHKPLEVFYDGRYELAQIYPADPVSACMPGGQQGRSVAYAEAQTETRQRALSVTLSKTLVQSDENNWSTSDGKTVTHGTTNTDGYSTTHGTQNSFTFSQDHSDSTGVSFNWSDANATQSGWVAGGNAGVSFKLFGVGVDGGGKYERNGATTNTSTKGGTTSSGSSNGWSQGQTSSSLDQSSIDHSTATTDSTAVTSTSTQGGSQSTQNGSGESVDQSWTVTSSQTIDRAFAGSVVAGTYGVFYRQMARYSRRAFVLEYNKCGEGDVIGDLTLQDYIWAPDLALGQACPPLPQSNFPQPQCYVAPCDP